MTCAEHAQFNHLEPVIFTLHIVKVLLILPWIATFINEVDFCAGPAFPSPASEALPDTRDSWVGWSNVSDISCSGKHNKYCLTFPI